jgi:hypothetical protein
MLAHNIGSEDSKPAFNEKKSTYLLTTREFYKLEGGKL